MTVKELSDELGVSEQALRQWCKKNNVRKERTQGTKASYILTFDIAEQARKHYGGEQSNASKESNERKGRKQSNESKETFLSQIEELKEANAQLTAQLAALEVKDALSAAQIEELKADKEYLRELVDRLTAQLDRVTAALQAAQALHGIEKKAKAIEAEELPKEDAPSERPQRPQSAAGNRAYNKPPQTLARLWKRLWRK
jgi:DNA-binding transcriptional MerR regulator